MIPKIITIKSLFLSMIPSSSSLLLILKLMKGTKTYFGAGLLGNLARLGSFIVPFDLDIIDRLNFPNIKKGASIIFLLRKNLKDTFTIWKFKLKKVFWPSHHLVASVFLSSIDWQDIGLLAGRKVRWLPPVMYHGKKTIQLSDLKLDPVLKGAIEKSFESEMNWNFVKK